MTISKTILNMAKRRGIAMVVISNDTLRGGRQTLEIGRFNKDGEPADEFNAAYDIAADGLFFVCGCRDTEEWPRWISDEQHLRSLLNDIAVEVKS